MILPFLKNQRYLVILFAFILFFQIQPITAQPEPPGGGHGQTGNQVPGGGAPVASGLTILLALSGIYGAKKILNQKEEEDSVS